MIVPCIKPDMCSYKEDNKQKQNCCYFYEDNKCHRFQIMINRRIIASIEIDVADTIKKCLMCNKTAILNIKSNNLPVRKAAKYKIMNQCPKEK
jgi:hypothetical protein